MSKTRKRAIQLGAVLIVILVTVWVFRPRPVGVQLVKVTRGPLSVTIEEQGQTRIRSRYVVAAPVAGRLAPILIREGTKVSQGQVLAEIAPLPLDARARRQAEAALAAAKAGVAEAEARVGQARAALGHSHQTLERNENLLAEGLVATADVDQMRAENRALVQALAAAEFAQRAAEGERALAQAALLETGRAAALPIPSPADGLVLRRFEESERVVPAGTPLLEIGDPMNLEVVVEVLSTDAVEVRPGMALVVDAGGAQPASGRVRMVEPAGFTKISPLGVEEQRVRVIGDLLGPAAGVGDRFRVVAQVVLWHGEDVLKVPSGALFRRGDGWGAYVVRDDRARLVEVTVGHRGADESEVSGGLVAGDEVIAYPSEGVHDGARVVSEG